MAGIREVAREAGVSISTVSYALNGSDKISEETRLRVQEIAKGLGYTPKLAARTLKGSKTNIVGVYISGFQGEFYGELLDGMQHQFELLGYDMMVSSGSRTHKFLSEKLFDGAIVMDYKFHNDEVLEVLNQGNKLVLLDREIEHDGARSVLLDNAQGSKKAVNYLLAQELDKYYVISGPKGNYDVDSRLAAALQTFSEVDKPVEILDGDFTEASGFEAAAKLFALHNQQQSIGMYALNDNEAMGFYRYAQEHQLQQELASRFKLVGFDNNHSADFLSPVLPSISYHKHIWGEKAAQTLVDLIEEKKAVQNQWIKTELSFRES
ncbi:MAG: LacI family transcriptional regulator [Streptococcaceae bacterium]|jgi:LacI family transcriptional regulator|nr:LacI family transcriptional regulator [Streptococcaceae bacterium]